jgi:formylmethanofuran dehydrogenase subunit B
LPVIAGLGTDVAGARAAIRLARRVGAVLDQEDSGALLRYLDVARDAGIMTITPREAGLRADVLVWVGDLHINMWGHVARMIRGSHKEAIVWLCPDRHRASEEMGQLVGRAPADLPVVLAALRATLAGRPVGRAPVPAKTLAKLAAQLQAARFGVVVWSAAFNDALTTEMLCGLINDLNLKTRFSGVPLPPDDNALGVLQVCGWMSALPPRTGFARGFAEHDPWRFDARRLVESGEADCVLWISAYHSARPPWRSDVPTIALTGRNASFFPRPRVHIEVGRPGLDHSAVQYLQGPGTLTWTHRSARTTVRVCDALDGIAAALPSLVDVPC